MTALVLDAQALSCLARGTPPERTVRAALTAALVEAVDVVVPAAVLAELYRGGGDDQAVDACLAREGGIAVAPTDRAMARRMGHLLAAAALGSEHHVDAGRRRLRRSRRGFGADRRPRGPLGVVRGQQGHHHPRHRRGLTGPTGGGRLVRSARMRR